MFLNQMCQEVQGTNEGNVEPSIEDNIVHEDPYGFVFMVSQMNIVL